MSPHDIIRTLAYFDLFDYPLTAQEIIAFLPKAAPVRSVMKQIRQLTEEGKIYLIDGFYALHADESLAARRRQGNQLARQMMPRANASAKLLARFPFVKGLAVSGSLSKNFADESSDIDFFIITAPDRLWIARSCMHLLKKLSFLKGRQHDFCMNYYISEDELLIREKNVYTATEVVTLIPLYGIEAFHEFFEANRWTQQFLPNHHMRIALDDDLTKPWWSRRLEGLLGNGFGQVLDGWLMKWTARRWQNKTHAKRRNSKGFLMQMDLGRSYCKPHPAGLQSEILRRYQVWLDYLLGLPGHVKQAR